MPNDENTALQLVGGGSVNAIDFSSMIVATDADGDEVPGAASGSFTVAVQDDIPIQVTPPTPVAATVEEDGMDAAVVAPEGINGIDLSTGNKEVGDTNADDEASGGLGSLSGLFSVGADEPLTISLSTTTSGLPTLLSKGEAVTYSVTAGVSSDTLTATAGGRTVFTLVVNADGSWTFDLDDQLDHVDDGANDENTALQLVGGGR